MNGFKMPSAAELYALEQRARVERAQVLGSLLRGAAHAVSRAFVNVVTKPYASRPRVMRHA